MNQVIEYSPIQIVELPKTTAAKLAFYADNCDKLADLITELRPRQLKMRTWWKKPECGTVGCALGWAVISGRFPGLQYRFEPELYGIEPVVNGMSVDFEDAAEDYFGYEAFSEIFVHDYFTNGNGTKSEVIKALRKQAAIYRGDESCQVRG